MVEQLKYARVVNPQINPNLTERVKWKDISNAVGHTDTLATSHYTKKKVTTTDKKTKKETTNVVYNYPYKVTAHDFGLDIPECAVIKKITVGVRMKTDTDGTGSIFPACGFYITDKKAGVSDDAKNKTGWHNGVYWAYSDTKLTKSLQTEHYVMSGEDFYAGGFKVSDLNKSYFGVDINFADKNKDQTVNLKWVWVEVKYALPKFTLVHNGADTSKDSPRRLTTGVGATVKFTLTQSKVALNQTRDFDVVVPWGTDIESIRTDNGSILNGVDNNHKIWRVDCRSLKSSNLTIDIMDYTVNDQAITVSSKGEATKCLPKLSKSFYYHTNRGWVDDYNEIAIQRISENPPHLRHESCFAVTSKAQSKDNESEFLITNDYDYDLIGLKLDDGITHPDVSIKSTNLDHFRENRDGTRYIPANINIELLLNVPDDNETYNVGFTLCMRPHHQGTNKLCVNNSSIIKCLDYKVLEPYEYHIGSTTNDKEDSSPYEKHYLLVKEEIGFRNHRIASELETGAFILPCKVKDGDAVMVQTKPNIHMYKWEELDYIGCVPVEHHHFDPKSTYKDSLLNTPYKNKRYMGKQLASDEDITLNIRLHPQQVTTIQGLIDMDKPIPINANHKCFEGDALNHRGWAEIYGIKAEETNPHWYKCDIDVKYLTHNLNTRFKINRGSKTFSKYPIPSLLADVISSGNQLSNDNALDFFAINTDGSYAYFEDTGEYEDLLDDDDDPVIWNGKSTIATINDVIYTGDDTDSDHYILDYLEDNNLEYKEPLVIGEPIQIWEDYNISDNRKNRFTLDEGQYISIKSNEPLSTITQISVDWMSNTLNEYSQNAISRIFRLIDEDGNPVFEYEYCDFEFEDEIIVPNAIDDTKYYSQLTGHVIGRVRVKGDFIEVINQEINMKTDVETGVPSDEDDASIDQFGATLHFQLNNGKLTVKDEGYSGEEVSSEPIELEGERYKWEMYWKNNNTDGEDQDIDSFIDIIVQDNVLDNRYASLYQHLYVSPFPVQGKQIAYTRNAEEGVLYYLKDDKESFTYLIEPYYQYHNGVDLRASVNEDGNYISVFNLNYGYRTIYLENGLVSLGINRLNGRMYLRRWDEYAKQYVTLFNLHLNKYDDVNINSISDDRIELQASDTTIIMYRGHPYVVFRHDNEAIGLDTTFSKIWGQSVDKIGSDYPAIYDLLNTDNLLPVCVTSRLDDDCVIVSEEETNLDKFKIKVITDDEVVEDEETEFTVEGVPNGATVYYLIDGDEVGSAVYPAKFKWTFEEGNKAHTIVAVYCGDATHSYSVSEPNTIKITAIEDKKDPSPTPTPTPTPTTGKLKLTMSASSTMKYRDGSKMIFTLTQGGKPVAGEDLEIVDFNHINTQTTNEKGQVILYNKRADSHPKKYKIGARYWEGADKPVKKVFQDVTVTKAIAEFKVKDEPKKVNDNFGVKLRDANNHDRDIKGVKITIKANSTDYKKKTNDNGNAYLKIKKEDKYKFVCTFNGNKDYEKCTLKYTKKVKK